MLHNVFGSIYPNLTFDYSNFLVDDRNDNYGACFKDKLIDVSKNTFEGKEKIFCPVTENLSDFICFMTDGKMIPRKGLSDSMRNRVSETIRVFNLNHISLKEIRKNIITHVITYRNSGLDDIEIKSFLKPMGFPTVVDWALKVKY